MVKKRSREQKLIEGGYNIIHERGDYMVFEKPKEFSFGWFITLSVFTGIGGFFYVIYYWTKKKDIVMVKK